MVTENQKQALEILSRYPSGCSVMALKEVWASRAALEDNLSKLSKEGYVRFNRENWKWMLNKEKLQEIEPEFTSTDAGLARLSEY